MRNQVADGMTITVEAPKAVVAGDLVVSESVCGVAVNDAESGHPCVLSLRGVYEFPVSSSGEHAAGTPVYVTSGAGGVGHTGSEFTFTDSGNTLIGYLWKPATSESSTVSVIIQNFIPAPPAA